MMAGEKDGKDGNEEHRERLKSLLGSAWLRHASGNLDNMGRRTNL
jgi:hypothetical protein